MIKSAGCRTVSRRRSSGDHWVSLWLCSRSRKSAGDQRISKSSNPAKILQKSSGHCRIYVQLGPRLQHPWTVCSQPNWPCTFLFETFINASALKDVNSLYRPASVNNGFLCWYPHVRLDDSGWVAVRQSLRCKCLNLVWIWNCYWVTITSSLHNVK